MLAEGEVPPVGAVRIEEFLNYFRFDCAPPAGDAPVAISTEVGPCPWNDAHLLALVGVADELGLLLTRSAHAGTAHVDRVIERAHSFSGEDPHENRAGFVPLAEQAAGLMRQARLARR